MGYIREICICPDSSYLPIGTRLLKLGGTGKPGSLIVDKCAIEQWEPLRSGEKIATGGEIKETLKASWYTTQDCNGTASTYTASVLLIRLQKKGLWFRTRGGNALQYRADARTIP